MLCVLSVLCGALILHPNSITTLRTKQLMLCVLRVLCGALSVMLHPFSDHRFAKQVMLCVLRVLCVSVEH
jgi:hypothetical protein